MIISISYFNELNPVYNIYAKIQIIHFIKILLYLFLMHSSFLLQFRESGINILFKEE